MRVEKIKFQRNCSLGYISSRGLHGEDKVKEVKWSRANSFVVKKKKILETTVHSRTMQETLVGTTENNSLLSALFGPQWECRLVLNLILLDELELL